MTLPELADAAATTEVPELIPSRPAVRPADIFTEVAIPGTKAALAVATGVAEVVVAYRAFNERSEHRFGAVLRQVD